jgi:hypothetical protein
MAHKAPGGDHRPGRRIRPLERSDGVPSLTVQSRLAHTGALNLFVQYEEMVHDPDAANRSAPRVSPVRR